MPSETDSRAWRQQLQTIAAASVADLQPPPVSARTRCGNPSCRRNWLGFLKDRRRPVFEDRWACGAHCLRALVGAAIRRESSNGSAPEYEHTHRIPLGLILLSRGWITQPQLHHAIAMQRQAGGGRIGRWLMEECGVAEEHILSGLALQWHCNVFFAHNFHPQPMALAAPREIIERSGMLPLRISRQGALRLAFTDRPDTVVSLALQRMTGLSTENGLLSHSEWKSAREALLQCEPVLCTVEQVADSETLPRRIASDLAGMQPRASRLVRIGQVFWLRMWLEDASLRGPHGTLPPSGEDVTDWIYTVTTGATA